MTKPTHTIKEPELQGVDRLTPAQFAAVSKALGLPERNDNSAFKAQHRGIIETRLSHLKPDGDEAHDLLARDAKGFGELSEAFGYPDIKNLSHTGRVERASALQKKMAAIAL